MFLRLITSHRQENGSTFVAVEGKLATATTHVDHLVAWARYPVDLGHNFVLADSRCNNQKRDRLPACDHLAAWVERNAQFGAQIIDELDPRRGVHCRSCCADRAIKGTCVLRDAGEGKLCMGADRLQGGVAMRDVVASVLLADVVLLRVF